MSRALVLNASYEPLVVVPLRRAVVLVLAEKAEVLHADGEWRSASTSVAAPTVIRLRHYVRVPYRARVPLTRAALMARDNSRCQFAHCNAKATTVEHVLPRSRGGPHEWENVVAACNRCNNKKGDRTLAEIGWQLRRPPRAPQGRGWLVAGIANRNPTWDAYLGLSSEPEPAGEPMLAGV